MKLWTSNSAQYRLARTIIQGIIGVLIANVDLIVSGLSFSPEIKAFIVALVMAILSPIMASLGGTELNKMDLPIDYFEGSDEDANR